VEPYRAAVAFCILPYYRATDDLLPASMPPYVPTAYRSTPPALCGAAVVLLSYDSGDTLLCSAYAYYRQVAALLLHAALRKLGSIAPSILGNTGYCTVQCNRSGLWVLSAD